MRRKSHQFSFESSFCYYYYSDIYQHCLKGFTFNLFFLFFLWIKAIAGFFPQTKLLFPFYPIRIIGFIFIFMTVFSTAILNQYWIWTLWPTICLTDQLNENIYLIGCTEQLFYIISTGNYFQGVHVFGTMSISALIFSANTSDSSLISISEEIHPCPHQKKENQ